MRVLLTDLGKLISDQLLEGNIIIDIDIPISRENSSFLCLRELLFYNNIFTTIEGLDVATLEYFNKYYLGIFFSDIVGKNKSFTIPKEKENESFQKNDTIITIYNSSRYKVSYQYPQAYIVKLSKIINSQFFTIIG